MHPGGIKFGLSQGLLELNGDKAVVSAPFLEHLSEIARRWVRRRKRVIHIFDMVVTDALHRMPYTLDSVPRQEFVPFYTGLDRVVFQTMMPIAEEVGMGYRFLNKYFVSEGVWNELHKDTRTTHPKTPNEVWRIQFRKKYAAILALCRRNAPAHLRHAELLTLCEFYEWKTDLERARMNAFTSSLFSKEFWERMTGLPWKGRE